LKSTFTKIIIGFFKDRNYKLPWRAFKPDPYFVLVSEVMLQQTQVSRVVPKFEQFISQLPTVGSLAMVSNVNLLQLWSGLGYNSRALRLKKACEIVCSDYNSIIPSDYKKLRALPGIGDYTASAILCFSFRKSIHVIDVNVHRVISRYFYICFGTNEVRSDSEIREILSDIMPQKYESEFFQGIMDIAREFCKKTSPHCSQCPLKQNCKSAGKLLYRPFEKKIEPMYLGIPRRIWRGRIVKILTENSQITFQKLLESLLVTDHHQWFYELCQKLEKEKIITMKKFEETILLSL